MLIGIPHFLKSTKRFYIFFATFLRAFFCFSLLRYLLRIFGKIWLRCECIWLTGYFHGWRKKGKVFFCIFLLDYNNQILARYQANNQNQVCYVKTHSLAATAIGHMLFRCKNENESRKVKFRTTDFYSFSIKSRKIVVLIEYKYCLQPHFVRFTFSGSKPCHFLFGLWVNKQTVALHVSVLISFLAFYISHPKQILND